MESVALKPCPFCGGKKLRIIEESDPASRYKTTLVACEQCNATGPAVGSAKDLDCSENARANWNVRALEIRLEKEANWLAKMCEAFCHARTNCKTCPITEDCVDGGNVNAWREAARKEMEAGNGE